MSKIIVLLTADPFYAGTPEQRKRAEWLAGLYHQYHMGQTHIRRIHYKLISLQVKKWIGIPDLNTDEDARMLYDAATIARYLDLIPVEAFEDHRNDKPLNWAMSVYEEKPKVKLQFLDWLELELPGQLDLPTYQLKDLPEQPESLQRYHIELWCEKTTMNDVLSSLAMQYHLIVQTAAGQMSLTAVYKLIQRIKRYGKPTRILYISDFDPSGQDMPVAVAQKIAWCLQREELEDVDVKLYPLVLTHEQVQQYKLPRTPIKSGSTSKPRFEELYGVDAVELDALEALYPGELRKILSRAINQYYERGLGRQVEKWKSELENYVEEVENERLEPFKERIEELEQIYQELVDVAEEPLKKYNTLFAEVAEDVQQAMEEVPDDLEEVPLGEERAELEGALYDSGLGYYEQVVVLKQYQGKYDREDGIGGKKRAEKQQASTTSSQEEAHQQRIERLSERLQQARTPIEIGLVLLEAKGVLAWREFLPWARLYTTVTPRQLRNYMKMATEHTK